MVKGYFVFFIVLSFPFLLMSASIKYPILLEELGDVLVTDSILSECLEGAKMTEIIPSEKFQALPPVRIYAKPVLNNLPLYMITKYFMERNVLDLIKNETELTILDLHFSNILRNHLENFNTSFLDENLTNNKQIILFGTVFFRLFKAAYPGLKGVKLSKIEIVDLCLIASGWFMSTEEEDINDLDFFFTRCLKAYCPEYSVYLPNYCLDYYKIHNFSSKITFEAAFQLIVKRIPKRSNECLNELIPPIALIDFLHDHEMFLKFLPHVSNINESFTLKNRNSHILFNMIKNNLFYPEAFLRPELRNVSCLEYANSYFFQNFYSEALYYAMKSSNIEALNFLLNLDYSYYREDSELIESHYETDSDLSYFSESDSDSDTYSDINYLYGKRTISVATYNSLRALFYSISIEEIHQVIPEVFLFKFCDFSTIDLILKFKNNFPALMRLNQFFNELIEKKYRDEIPSSFSFSFGLSSIRPNTPTIEENKIYKI